MTGPQNVEYAVRKPKTSNGATGEGHKAILTDDQIKQMRALYDYRGWRIPALAEHFGQTYDVTRRAIEGLTRARLMHSIKDVPEGL